MLIDQKIKKSFIGVYLIDNSPTGVALATTKKPNWFRKIFIKIFLGWEYLSISEYKKITKK